MGSHRLLQGYLPYPGVRPTTPALAGGFFTTESPGKLPTEGYFASTWQSAWAL